MGGMAAAAVLVFVTGYHYWRLYSFRPYIEVKMSPAAETARRQRIIAIYNSLNLPNTYTLVDENIFGDKRQYSWDKGRTMASSRLYTHGVAPGPTFGELVQLVDAAGFTFVDEPYPNAIDKEMHFKDAQGEYLRLKVSSKPRDDALRAAGPNGNLAGVPDGMGGPSNVMIEINLNDNND